MAFKTGKNQGFTLVEVAIVMLIGGILTAAAAAALSVYMKQTRLKVTNERLNTINAALQTYVNQNGIYPCPAWFNAALDTPEFGVGVANCAAVAPNPQETVQANGPDGLGVRIGAVPVRTLNLPDDYIADSWGSRFTYAVTEALTNAATYDADDGDISVIDSAGQNVIVTPEPGSGHYVVISHGENRAGAVPTNGGGGVPVCPAGNWEEENCNRDATFRSTLLISEGANQFDDLVRARSVNPFGATIPSGAIMAFNRATCPDGWSDYTNLDERVIIGMPTGGGGYDLGDIAGDNDDTLALSELGYGIASSGINPTALIPLASGGVDFLRPVGGGPVAHDTRQGYVALKYCEKI